jgi:hypothetical protein
MIAYKIFDLGIGKDTVFPKTLFHGVNGSRRLPVGKWINAEQKMVTDGSGTTRYLSGFHAYETLDDIRNWLRGAKNIAERVVVRVHVRKCRSKDHAVRKTILADQMLITVKDWDARERASAYLPPKSTHQ